MENEVKDVNIPKKMYKCAVCGKIYDNIQDRMNCERKCIEEVKAKNEELLKAKREQEKLDMEKDINNAANKYYEMLNNYIDKYKTYPKVTIKNNFRRSYEDLRSPFDEILNIMKDFM